MRILVADDEPEMAMVLEALRSPEGQELIAQAVWKELAKRR